MLLRMTMYWGTHTSPPVFYSVMGLVHLEVPLRTTFILTSVQLLTCLILEYNVFQRVAW